MLCQYLKQYDVKHKGLLDQASAIKKSCPEMMISLYHPLFEQLTESHVILDKAILHTVCNNITASKQVVDRQEKKCKAVSPLRFPHATCR